MKKRKFTMILISGVTKEEKATWLQALEESEHYTMSAFLREILESFEELEEEKTTGDSFIPISGLNKDSITCKELTRSKAIRYFINRTIKERKK